MKTDKKREPREAESAEQAFADNLREWMEKHYWRREKELAKFLGCPYTKLNNLKCGRRFGTETWRREIAGKLGLDYEEMVGARSEGQVGPGVGSLEINVVNMSDADAPQETTGFRYIPLHEDGMIALGFQGPSLAREQAPDNAVVVNKRELQSRVDHDVRAIRVNDDSMWPRLPEGSIVFVDTDDRKFIDGKIYIVQDPETVPPKATIKTVRKLDQKHFSGYALVSENQRYLPIMSDENWEDLVVGRAVWVWRNLEGPQIEAQFQHTRRMESIDWLAGGIAHDLNNLLYPIMGYGEIILANAENPDVDELKEHVNHIIGASKRAQALTRQLLAFSRQKIQEFLPIDVNEMLRNFEQVILRPILDDDVVLRMQLTSPLPTINGEEDQIEQILVNIVNNAQDAMPEGGDLTVSTDWLDMTEKKAKQYPGLKPGRYVYIDIKDTGVGMDKETAENAFDPFFTTKKENNSSGLGLSIAYGVIKQHGGGVYISSKPGAGTTVKIFLPEAPKPPQAKSEEFALKELPEEGDEKTNILLVEDEGSVRELCQLTLEQLGYTVLAVKDGKEAVDAANNCKEPVHLMLLDVILPDVSGKELYNQLCAIRPNVPVIYMSGYPANVITRHGVLPEEVHFVQKPFSKDFLDKKIKEVLSGQ